MRKIYKIKFEIDASDNASISRDQNILAILSELQDIESDTPMPFPTDGSNFIMGKDEFKVISHKYSFNVDGDIFYYQTILKVKSLSQIEEDRKKRKKLDDQDLIFKLKQLAGDSSKNKWDPDSFDFF